MKNSVESIVFMHNSFDKPSMKPADDLSSLVDMAEGVSSFAKSTRNECGCEKPCSMGSCSFYGQYTSSNCLKDMMSELGRETYYAYAKKEGDLYPILNADNLGIVDSGDMVIFYGYQKTPEEFFRQVVEFKDTYNEVFDSLGSRLDIVQKNNPTKKADLFHIRINDVVSKNSEKQEYYAMTA